MTYEEKIALLNGDDFFSFFEYMRAQPRWVNSAGKRAIQLIGLCHHGENHSALFDPSTLKVNCFSECGGGMLLHTWIKRALDLPDPELAKQFMEDYIAGQRIDLTGRVPISVDFGFTERPFKIEHIEPVEPIRQDIIDELYETQFTQAPDVMRKLRWHTEDKIDVDIMLKYDVAYFPRNGTIILPHHNINGKIVGLYERGFRMLRKDFYKLYPGAPFQAAMWFPRAKYVPLVRDEKYREMLANEEKTSWSFANSRNLYGLHIAAPYIKESGEAIIFEGAKSVMLAHQWGIKNCVASHTFGCHFNHINMLYECGARKIFFAFDKQYKEQSDEDHDWYLYNKRTTGMAAKIKDEGGLQCYRIIDVPNTGVPLDHKDAPVDKGKEKFLALLEAAHKSRPLWPEEPQDLGEMPRRTNFVKDERVSQVALKLQNSDTVGDTIWSLLHPNSEQ